MPQPHFFEVNGIQLQNVRLDSFDALDVASRLLGFISAAVPLVRPVIYAVNGGPALEAAGEEGEQVDPQAATDATMSWLLAFLDDPRNQDAISKAIRGAFAEMPDADRRFVITKCMGAVRRVLPDGNKTTPIMNGQTILFQELKSPVTMLAITIAVAKDMVTDFLSDPAWRSVVEQLGLGSIRSGSLGIGTGSGGR